MADVRCSMCGKLNPEGADVCRFCGARLTPLTPGSNPPAANSLPGGVGANPPAPAGGDEPDWLDNLRANETGSAWQDETPAGNEAPGSEPSDAEVPDWLSRVRQRNDEEKTPFDPFGLGSSEGEDVPDWLKGLSGDAPAGGQPAPVEPSPETPETPAAGDEEDWLSGLRAGGESAPSAETPEEPSLPLGLAGEEWLSNLTAQDAPAEPSEPEPSASPEAAQPAAGEGEDWLAGLQGFTAPEAEPLAPAPSAGTTPVGGETDLSAWLRSLDETAGAQPPAAQASTMNESAEGEEPAARFNDAEFETSSEAENPALPADEGAGLPNWLAQTPAAPSETPAGEGEGEVPAWLAGTPAAPEAPEASPAPAESFPDWLSQAKPQAPEDAAPDWSGGPRAEETPGWFNQLQQPEGEAPASAGSDEELPAWMKPEEAAQEPAQDAEIPAWMQPAETTQEPAQPGEIPAWMQTTETPPPAQGEEMPDFSELFALEETPTAKTPAGEETSPVEAAAPLGMAAAEAAGEADSEIPDWLQGFGKAGQAQEEAGVEEPSADFLGKTPAQAAAEASPPFVDENLPSWLSQIKPPAGAPEAESGVSPLLEPEERETAADLGEPFKVDLPSWMDRDAQTPTPEAEAEAAETEQPEEELEPAELPSWVEDLRPLESVIPGELQTDANEVKVEKAGPLAGMRGLLQGEELATRYRKLPTYSARLRISERQRAHAQLLENVLADEAHPQEIPSEPSRAPQLILRVIIALLLVLALLPMLIPGFQLVPVPTAYPAGLTSMYNQVEGLPANAPVLLAVDYEPGLSGEMRFAGNAVLEHLMVKNARMTFVSTVPTGPVLADQMLREVQSRRQEYNLAEQTVNLGYLPGGTTSLLEFSQNPRGAAPVALDSALTGVMAWDRPALQNVNRLQDFALVIVLTDSAETGRAWIEQVKPQMGGVPLAMVASAQAGPLLQPYLDSGQINGLSVGLMGGAMYEQKSGRVNLANQYWGSFQSGSLAGLLLLIIGGVFSVIFSFAGWTRKRKA